MHTLSRPSAEEYAPIYRDYVALAGDGDVLAQLAAQHDLLASLLGPLDEAGAAHRYAPGKWSIKEVLGHVIDIERLFGFRALAFARQPGLELPGCDQDQWAASAGSDRRSLADLLAELAAVRRASLTLFAGFDETQLSNEGVVEGHRLTVRAIPYMLTGHDLHHLGILKERYLA